MLFRSRLFTDAFVIGRDPLHEIIAPYGNNTSGVEQGQKVLSETFRVRPADGLVDRISGSSGPLVRFVGFPVAMQETAGGTPASPVCAGGPDGKDCDNR